MLQDQRLQRKLEQLARKQVLVVTPPQKKEQKTTLSITDRMFLWFARPIRDKTLRLEERVSNPKLASAKDILVGFEKLLQKVSNKLNKGKQPDSKIISAITMMLPLIGSIPIRHWELEYRVEDVLVTTSYIANTLEEGPAQIALVGLLSLINAARKSEEVEEK